MYTRIDTYICTCVSIFIICLLCYFDDNPTVLEFNPFKYSVQRGITQITCHIMNDPLTIKIDLKC